MSIINEVITTDVYFSIENIIIALNILHLFECQSFCGKNKINID